jgi:hypothetical protein
MYKISHDNLLAVKANPSTSRSRGLKVLTSKKEKSPLNY